MSKHNVTIFKPYTFSEGEKIQIDGGPRGGDWEVVGISERKVKLRCPISKREFEWDRFCYQAGVVAETDWPKED